MRIKAMDEDEFGDLLDRSGGDGERWPIGRRDAAATLLARSAAARRLLAETIAMEVMLRAEGERLPAAAASAKAAQAMAAHAMRQPQLGRAPRLMRRAGLGLAAALVLAAGLALGVSAGRSGGGTNDGIDDAPSQLVASALGPRSGGAGSDVASDVD